MRLRLEGVSLRARRRTLVHPLDLDVPAGITVLLGARNAGKTTLLRLMAGLAQPTQGRVLADGQDVTAASVRHRDVAMVHQSFVNYPSLTVFDNIASPLAVRGASGIHETVSALAARLRLPHLLDRLPAELSAGEQQRVALARALAKGAALVLLDEPLSSLDPALRQALREELADHFGSGESAAVFTTADPAEALLLGGQVAVLEEGRLLQAGPAAEVYLRPATVGVARVFSDPPMNLLPARLQHNSLQIAQGPRVALQAPLVTDNPEVTVGIRADSLAVTGHAGDLRFDARAELAEIAGSATRLHAACRAGTLAAQLPGVQRFEPGQNLSLYADPGALHVFDHAGQLLLAPEVTQLRDAQRQRLQPEPVKHGAH